MAEAVCCDNERWLGDAEDVLELLCPVEVHDGHHDRAGIGGAPERDGGLYPVRELEDHDVARPDVVVAQPAGESPGVPIEVGDGAAPGPDR